MSNISNVRKLRNGGFTLLELLITMAIGAVLVGMAIPNFTQMIERNKVQTARESLVSALQYARSEALTRKSPITICASANGSNCNAGTNWNQGWIVFSDDNGNGNRNGAEITLQRHDMTPNGDVVVDLGAVSSGRVVYAATGFAAQGDQVIGFCAPHHSSIGSAVTISATGSVMRGDVLAAACP